MKKISEKYEVRISEEDLKKWLRDSGFIFKKIVGCEADVVVMASTAQWRITLTLEK